MLQILESSHSLRNEGKNPKFVPLKKVHVDANIRSFAADVTIQQVFQNDETTPIEAVYCFPIEEQAAVYAFIARIDDREVRAKLKKKDEAQREYVHALRGGHGAYLLEQDEKSPDNFIVNMLVHCHQVNNVKYRSRTYPNSILLMTEAQFVLLFRLRLLHVTILV